MIRKFVARSLIASMLFMSLSFPVKEARAFAIVAMSLGARDFKAIDGSGSSNPLALVLCAILLPACILDRDDSGANDSNLGADLAASGYSNAEISLVLNDRNMINQSLAAQGKQLQLSQIPGDNNFDNFVRVIRGVHPHVSNTYLAIARERIYGHAPQ